MSYFDSISFDQEYDDYCECGNKTSVHSDFFCDNCLLNNIEEDEN